MINTKTLKQLEDSGRKDRMFYPIFDEFVQQVTGQKYSILVPIEDGRANRYFITLLELAAFQRMCAGYNGASDDGGASRLVNRAEGFLEGYNLVDNGNTTTDMETILNFFKKENSPKYKRYLELKAEFEPD